jgi:hypothetical protein
VEYPNIHRDVVLFGAPALGAHWRHALNLSLTGGIATGMRLALVAVPLDMVVGSDKLNKRRQTARDTQVDLKECSMN